MLRLLIMYLVEYHTDSFLVFVFIYVIFNFLTSKNLIIINNISTLAGFFFSFSFFSPNFAAEKKLKRNLKGIQYSVVSAIKNKALMNLSIAHKKCKTCFELSKFLKWSVRFIKIRCEHLTLFYIENEPLFLFCKHVYINSCDKSRERKWEEVSLL